MWNILSSSNGIWKPFCSKHWENDESVMWKEMYILWLRRMAYKWREMQNQNEIMAEKQYQTKSTFYPLIFFWPSYA